MNNYSILASAIILLFAAYLMIRENRRGKRLYELAKLNKDDIQNEQMRNYNFLSGMRSDTYFPDFLVDKCENILIDLCIKIESQQPKNLRQLYKLTHASTRLINSLEDEFYANDSEIETAAREVIAMDFDAIAQAYNFKDADIETLIATRSW